MSLEKALADSTAATLKLVTMLATFGATVPETATGDKVIGVTTGRIEPTAETAPMAGAEKATTTKTKTNKTPKSTTKEKGTGPKGKDQAHLKDHAMTKLKEVMSEKGKEALAGVLNRFGCKKFSEIGNDQYSELIELAEKALAEKEVTETEESKNDLLGDDPGPEVTGQVLTLEDVKKLLVEISNEDGMGMPAARKILEASGCANIKSMTEDKFAAVHAAATKALKENDEKVEL